MLLPFSLGRKVGKWLKTSLPLARLIFSPSIPP